MALEVKSTETRKGVFTVHPVGAIDSNTDTILEKEFNLVLPNNPTEIVLDMKGVEYISSAGLRVIIKAKKAQKKNGGNFLFLNLQPQIQKVFDIINALPSMQVFTSIAELDDYLDKMQREETD